jgi:hypothetical protein
LLREIAARFGGGKSRAHHQLAFLLSLCPQILRIRWKASKPESGPNPEKRQEPN